MKDKNGRDWFKLADAKQGMVELDGGFTCRKAGKAMLFLNGNGQYYFFCADGNHYIAGQADDGTHCIGIYPMKQDAIS